jgi:predicted alternative tryptophan synthase beta-subunit
MQPGDYTDIVLSVKNEHKATTHWYMTNEVLKTLEDTRDAAALSGGAYTYRLAYKSDASGEEKVILFNLSGHGLIDMGAYDQFLAGNIR